MLWVQSHLAFSLALAHSAPCAWSSRFCLPQYILASLRMPLVVPSHPLDPSCFSLIAQQHFPLLFFIICVPARVNAASTSRARATGLAPYWTEYSRCRHVEETQSMSGA